MADIIEITSIDSPNLDIYTHYNEAQLLHFYEPQEGIFIAESPRVITRALDAGYKPLSFLVEKKCLLGDTLRVINRCGDVPVYTADSDVLAGLTGYALTRGMLCAMLRSPLPDFKALCRDMHRIAVLEDIVNPTNVGAIFRSAAALHMDAVLLTPACSDPLYRRAARVSMGTVFQIPWTYLPKSSGSTSGSYIHALREIGFKTAAMALRDDSISIDAPVLRTEEKLAILLGTEGDGLSASSIANSDYIVRIPMSNNVDSLNVAAASAVAFWEIGKGNTTHEKI